MGRARKLLGTTRFPRIRPPICSRAVNKGVDEQDQSPDSSQNHPEVQDEPPGTRPWNSDDWLALLGVTFIAAFTRFFRLGLPGEFVFDEVFYAKDACMYWHDSVPYCDFHEPPAEVHPPLAKWIMGAGIRIFGFDAFGWRSAGAAVGAITVVLLYLLARKLLASTAAATIAAGLLALDPLHFVMSRTAILDVYVPVFGVGAFMALAYDRSRILSRARDPATRNGRLNRPWRLVAGLFATGAAAAKWSGVLFLVGVVVISVAWEWWVRRQDGRGRVFRRLVFEEGPSLVLYFFVVPLVAYIATFISRIDGTVLAAPWAEGSWWRNLWNFHEFAFDFHFGLPGTHVFASPPWSWPLIKRALPYWFETTEQGQYSEILATGNPLTWWLALGVLIWIAIVWFKNRDPRMPEGLVLGSFAFSYLPWVALSRGRAAVFIFYFVASVPFLYLALGYTVARLWREWKGRIAVVVVTAAAVGIFFFYYPVMAYVPIDEAAWKQRIWVFDNCDKQKPPLTTMTNTVTQAIGPETTIVKTFTRTRVGGEDQQPPEGWCWI
jgi:dolichyl-phosphate-mannose-protein mannosyltransferase